jgi:hypothetical protein
LRPPAALGPLPLVQLAGDAGCAGVCVDGGCLLDQLPQLALKTVWARMTLPALLAPLPAERLSPGRRLPTLAASDDPEERLAAVALVRRIIEGTRDLGVGIYGLDFGRLPLVADEAEIRALFARRALEEGEPGHARLQAATAERRRRSAAAVDACRASLDALVRVAERLEIKLAIRFAGSLWEAPSPRETTELLVEYAGGPVGVVYSPARLATLAALGLNVSSERREALRQAAALLEGIDAVGLDGPLVAGLGEVGLAELRPDSARPPVILSGPADATLEEIGAARAMLE